ncbi:MAG: hypothetical protein ACI93T_002183 [Porticoccaceae bacterium]|jgi:hypothetical protein
MNEHNRLPLEHLDRMTDSTGLIQHAIYSIPRRESGYTTDDNARSLRLCVRLWGDHRDERMLSRVACYLGFLEHSRSPVRGFHNFMGYQRDWLDSGGTEDCQGQAVLALAEVSGSDLPCGFRDLSHELLDEALPALAELRSLRAQAYVIQAWAHLSRAGVANIEPLGKLARLAADRLVDCYNRSHRPDWPWFESRMTYANAVLPHALFDAAERWPDESYFTIAETSFGFLDLATSTDDMFWPIGSDDWYSRGEEKSLYAQQPVEASTMASAALAALRLTGDDKYLTVFKRCHSWFLGKNSLNDTLADVRRGACFDGLEASGPNRNQGAESTLAWLWTEMLAQGLQQAEAPRVTTETATAIA